MTDWHDNLPTPDWVSADGSVVAYNRDCLDLLRELPSGCLDAVVTDPPYCSGGRQAAGARQTISKAGISRADDDWFLGDNMGADSYLWLMRAVGRECVRVARNGSQGIFFTDWRQYGTVTTALESVRWTLRNVLVWDKAKGGAMGSYWRNNHEWAAIFTKGKPRALAHCSAFNTWTGTKPQGGEHPTEKPVALMEYLLGTVALPATILDPFAGSFTTAVAAVNTGRRCIVCEIDPGYFRIGCDRVAKAVAARAEQLPHVA